MHGRVPEHVPVQAAVRVSRDAAGDWRRVPPGYIRRLLWKRVLVYDDRNLGAADIVRIRRREERGGNSAVLPGFLRVKIITNIILLILPYYILLLVLDQ